MVLFFAAVSTQSAARQPTAQRSWRESPNIASFALASKRKMRCSPARTRSGGRGGEPRPRRAPPTPPSAPPPLQEGEEARGARRRGRASPLPSPAPGDPGT